MTSLLPPAAEAPPVTGVIQAARHDVWIRLPAPLSGVRVAVAAIVLVAVATAIGEGLSHWLPQQSVALVYLLAVMLAALAFGMSTGLSVALLSFLADNFFFIEPLYTFTISDPQELFALSVFLVVALITGSLAGRMRQVADAAVRRAAALQTLNDFAATLSGTRDLPTIGAALAAQASSSTGSPAVVLMADTNGLRLDASSPGAPELEPAEMQAATRALRSGETIHAAATGWPGPRYEFRPLLGARSVIGVVGLGPRSDSRAFDGENSATIATLLRHAAIAIERTRLEAETASARHEAERERLRAALLSSLSHDLRTPLASILGAVTSLRDLGDAMTPDTRADLLAAIEEETQRLSRFVSNLLDMTRLEAAAIDLVRDWVDMADVTQIAVARARRLFPRAVISLDLPRDGLPSIPGDPTLLEHVVFNLIDNAVKFSSDRPVVTIALSRAATALTLTVTDAGRGIPGHAMSQIFEPFYRADGGIVPGTGLGLAICKRIVEGMRGSIGAESPVAGGRGSRFTVSLPTRIAQPATAGAEGQPT